MNGNWLRLNIWWPCKNASEKTCQKLNALARFAPFMNIGKKHSSKESLYKLAIWILPISFFFLSHFKSQSDTKGILQPPGTYILLPGRLQKYNAWIKTTERNKNTKGEKEVKKNDNEVIMNNNNNNNNKKASAVPFWQFCIDHGYFT